jgi:hypothetical protein
MLLLITDCLPSKLIITVLGESVSVCWTVCQMTVCLDCLFRLSV